MAGNGNDLLNEIVKFEMEVCKQFATSYATSVGTKLGEEVVKLGSNTLYLGLNLGLKLGKLAVSTGDECVKNYGMYLLANGVVNIANEVGGERRKKKLRVVKSYTPVGMSDMELTCRGAKLVWENHIVPLKPVLPSLPFKKLK